MKKILVVMFGMMLLAAPAFAVNDLTGSGTLTVGGGALTAAGATGNCAELAIGLSPKVFGRYVTDGIDETSSQWYALGTVHPGGNVGYGTAQDVNNIYMMAFLSGDATTTVTEAIQTTKAPAGSVDADGNPVAAATWLNAGWTTTTPTAQ